MASRKQIVLELSLAQQALQEMADANDGRLTPEDVVEAAQGVDSPLHKFFTWDDAEAAHLRRLDEARGLIRTVKITIRTDTRIVKSVGYVRDPRRDASDSGYVSVLRIRDDEDAARDIVIAEFARAAAALKRARKIAHVLGMVDVLDALTEDLEVARLNVATAEVRAS